MCEKERTREDSIHRKFWGLGGKWLLKDGQVSFREEERGKCEGGGVDGASGCSVL